MNQNRINDDLCTIVNLLNKIDQDDSIDIRNHVLVNAVLYLADEHLTGEDGQSRANIEYIKKAGFDIFAGEQDRYGWLIGCIELKRGIIFFG